MMIKKYIAVLLALALVLALLLTPGQAALAQVDEQQGVVGQPHRVAPTAMGETPAGMSDQEWGSMQAQMRLAQYQFTWQTLDGVWAFRAPNQANGLELAFGYDGLMATRYDEDGQPSGQFGLRLARYGQQVIPAAIPAEGLSAELARVEYAWNKQVTEWYQNTPEGLKHGLTLHAPPAAGPTQLDFALSGDLQAEMDKHNGMLLRSANGSTVLRYDQLAVYDANGRQLATQMTLASNTLYISIDAAGAAYPLAVDPLLHTETAILRASDAQAGNYFGYSAAIAGDILVIGAYSEDGGAGDLHPDVGAAYVFQRDTAETGWGQSRILRPSDWGSWFGISTAISGDVIVVGAIGAASGAGAAYVFQRTQGGLNSWGQVKILTASGATVGDSFGFSVAISGDMIVVGAYASDSAGSAYIFQRNQGGAGNWGQLKYLSAGDDGMAGDRFGFSVAISGDVIVIGADVADGGGGGFADTGAAYVFQRGVGGPNNWGLAIRLTASDTLPGDHFGSSVSISGEVIVVGAWGQGNTGAFLDEAGAAYVFQRQPGDIYNWEQAAMLTASDAQASDFFGWSVAVSGDVIVVGAYGEDSGGSASGAAYVFQRDRSLSARWQPDGWGQAQILHASEAQEMDFFGYAVAISGDQILVGAPYEDGGTGSPISDAGTAYIFLRTQNETWQQTGLAHASDMHEGDRLGKSVAVSGDVIVVGAFWADTPGVTPLDAGAAYVFQREKWTGRWSEMPTLLRASDAQAGDYFGYSAAIAGDVIVVGACQEDGGDGDPMPNAGAAYVFGRDHGGVNNWGQVKILHALNAAAGDLFGISVAVSGDVVVAGAYMKDTETGAAYVFQRDHGGASNWGQVKILQSSTADIYEDFGASVAVDGDVIVVGAPYADQVVDEDATGAAIIFQRSQGGVDNWGEVKILYASDPHTEDWFGQSVAIAGDMLVVGAPRYNGIGAAFVFQRDQNGIGGWGETTILQVDEAQPEDLFGYAVAISKDMIVAGSNHPGPVIPYAGAAYVFRRNQSGTNNWGLLATLRASDASAYDYFGLSVAICDDVIAIGAPYEDGGAGDLYSNAGALYIFQPTPPRPQAYLPLVGN